MTDGLDRLNRLSPAEAEAELLRCCGSTAWARRVVAARPFASEAALLAEADAAWASASRDDVLEAFSRHPRIGEQKAEKPAAATGEWSRQEQAGVSDATDDVRRELAEGNAAYFDRFGYIFLVCATGKSAEEMLGLLRARLGNAPDDELRVAAEEQRKIMHIRLRKLLIA
ncbi:MAG TPA: 2-oxo-4-hydroxy-4-carboxy-5-ureidoimidazoline decarboxylase [Longimicrobiaceae bacterium]|jgi:2-oxo-4-hydroxy-4-carboxy-5-ureidoimidazoline decarboxylase|nr:2-oxo-4-hydroxy-4-carboxy-5-ureidoimidazoline decarboxylase [Longimicrobiaceae bacterium]